MALYDWTEWIHGSSDEAVAASIRNGIPDTEMVAFSSVLTELQIRSMVIFLREMKMKSRQNLSMEIQGEP